MISVCCCGLSFTAWPTRFLVLIDKLSSTASAGRKWTDMYCGICGQVSMLMYCHNNENYDMKFATLLQRPLVHYNSWNSPMSDCGQDWALLTDHPLVGLVYILGVSVQNRVAQVMATCVVLVRLPIHLPNLVVYAVGFMWCFLIGLQWGWDRIFMCQLAA